MDFEKRLQELVTLEDNWDDRGSPAPNKKSLQSAQMILKILKAEKYLPTMIMPSTERGLGFIFQSDTKYADIECFNDGDILAGYSDRKGDNQLWELKNNEEAITDTINRIRIFLSEESIIDSMVRISTFLNK